MSDQADLHEISIKLERYSPSDYFDYVENENTGNVNSSSTTENTNNEMAGKNNDVASSEIQAMGTIDSAGLLELLTEWDLVCLYKSCTDQLVDVESFKFITPAQCNMLAAKFPLGIKIKFVAKVMQWRGY